MQTVRCSIIVTKSTDEQINTNILRISQSFPRRKLHIPPKLSQTFTRLHGVTSQGTKIFLIVAMTSPPPPRKDICLRRFNGSYLLPTWGNGVEWRGHYRAFPVWFEALLRLLSALALTSEYQSGGTHLNPESPTNAAAVLSTRPWR